MERVPVVQHLEGVDRTEVFDENITSFDGMASVAQCMWEMDESDEFDEPQPSQPSAPNPSDDDEDGLDEDAAEEAS